MEAAKDSAFALRSPQAARGETRLAQQARHGLQLQSYGESLLQL